MRKILSVMALLLSAAACGSSPTAAAPAEAKFSDATGDEWCTKYAMAGGHRACQPPSDQTP